MIIKKNNEFQVRSMKGKLLGSHPSRERAEAQLRAIERAKSEKKK